MEENPYQPPLIPGDGPTTTWEWRKHPRPRIVAALFGGLLGWLLSPTVFDDPFLATVLAVGGTACGAVVGYAACLLTQIALDNNWTWRTR